MAKSYILHFTFAQHYKDYSSTKQCTKHFKAKQNCPSKYFFTLTENFGAEQYPGIMQHQKNIKDNNNTTVALLFTKSGQTCH